MFGLFAMILAIRMLVAEAIDELAMTPLVTGATCSPAHSSSILVNCWRIRMRYEAHATSCFVHPRGADCNALLRFESSLRVIRRLATLHADRMCLCDVFGNRK